MISAKIIADSISRAGKRITTFELEYPRFIHSEVMTHRMVSKNAASSRAIPLSATIEQILRDPAMPVWWGKNQAGMQAKEELDDVIKYSRDVYVQGETFCFQETEKETAKRLWLEARDSAVSHAQQLQKLGLHKQISNRTLEPWVNIKVVSTATDWDNLFHLRRHEDTQPEFHVLADEMWFARENSSPVLLEKGEWHLPYVTDPCDLETGLKLSSSLCAQVSYRKSDDSIAKALDLYERLVNAEIVHASPFEHQATPLEDPREISGNLRGWFQHRQMIPNNTCFSYQESK